MSAIQAYTDTIVAIVTGALPSPVAIVRLSGPESFRIAACVFPRWPDQPSARKAVYGDFAHGDDGLAMPFPAGQSYTGDECVEFSLHGARASVDALIQPCLGAGARLALPGEFTLRAFMSGRLDLTQAEAIRDTIEAETESQLRAANRNRSGRLREPLAEISNELMRILVTVEASVDFSDEVGELDREAFSRECASLAARLHELRAAGHANHVARLGKRIAIVGPPNAGKSSLLNALLGKERSIVTPEAGTTRDFIEETLDVGGTRIVLIDTAGLRESSSPAERIGVERSKDQASQADEVWLIYDATAGWNDAAQQAAEMVKPTRIFANKSDLASADFGTPISALTGAGLAELVLSLRSSSKLTDAPYVNERQERWLALAESALLQAEVRGSSEDPADLLTVLLRDALNSIGQITGVTSPPDVIEEMFSHFCIGK